MAEPCLEAKELAVALTGYLVHSIRTTSEFGPTGAWSQADKELAQKIQAVIDKAKEQPRD